MTMTYTTLLFDLRDAVATVTINRPDKLNALNATVIAELGDVAGRVEKFCDASSATGSLLPHENEVTIGSDCRAQRGIVD